MLKAEFIAKTQHLDLIDDTALAFLARNDAGFYNQISQWAREGLLERISKGRYILSRKQFGQRISNEALACRIVACSYVSMSSVLATEMMIPESYTGRVVTSVTWRKPRHFESSAGTFLFRHIKQSGFSGFETRKDEYGKPFKRATATKALLDLLYLDTKKVIPSTDYLDRGLRLQKLEKISVNGLRSYQGVFSKKLDRWIELIMDLRRTAKAYS